MGLSCYLNLSIARYFICLGTKEIFFKFYFIYFILLNNTSAFINAMLPHNATNYNPDNFSDYYVTFIDLSNCKSWLICTWLFPQHELCTQCLCSSAHPASHVSGLNLACLCNALTEHWNGHTHPCTHIAQFRLRWVWGNESHHRETWPLAWGVTLTSICW